MEIKTPNKNLLETISENYKRLKKLQKELFVNANALWFSIPYGTKISCCDEGIEIHNDEHNGLIIAFVKDDIDGNCVEIKDSDTDEIYLTQVTEISTENYLYLVNFIAEKYAKMLK